MRAAKPSKKFKTVEVNVNIFRFEVHQQESLETETFCLMLVSVLGNAEKKRRKFSITKLDDNKCRWCSKKKMTQGK